MLTPAVPQSAAIHALTAGAAGTMILAVMTRATRGHTGHALRADRATSLIYLLVNAAALARVAAAFGGAWSMPLLSAAGLLWIAAFILFCLAYGPMLLRPPAWGVKLVGVTEVQPCAMAYRMRRAPRVHPQTVRRGNRRRS